ncbi:MAG: S8 family serine peptidase [Candidatus Edwardsbacteria bacterium]|jgi:hypothetical protein|nr:S8 family serine peptidase [Candidatus Edwardsbacteria bacterium]
MRQLYWITIAGMLVPTMAAVAVVPPTVTPRLVAQLEHSVPAVPVPVLVFFRDKGIADRAALDARRLQLSQRALARRAKCGAAVTFEDLPVCEQYVREIEATGARQRQRLNWFNAASFEMTAAQAAAAADLPFVMKIDLLPARRRTIRPEPPAASAPGGGSPAPKSHLLDYGPSLTQDSLVNAVICHDSGYSGAGVLVAMFDNGFRRDHQAFDSIFASGRLVDEWDFCTNADTVEWASHGTGTWSEAGGYVPGQLIGPAYGALWAIYHTEDNRFELNVEEDHWAAALQRADSVGADVVSSSLGYFTFDSSQQSYSYADMDGSTAISSLAARHAAALGIIVCNAMGNSGPSAGSLSAPADADSILAVGNVDSFGMINPGSSRGPTYDGRPKPEVCAQGTNIYWASWTGASNYTHYATGTSCATPLVAGACALVLEAHPGWTALQVREALMMTADRSAAPDSTTYGWGIIDAWAAIHYDGSGVGHNHPGAAISPGLRLSCWPNPSRSAVTLACAMPRAAEASVSIYDVAGRLVRVLPGVRLPAGGGALRWDGLDRAGRRAAGGVYLCRLAAAGATATSKVVLLR